MFMNYNIMVFDLLCGNFGLKLIKIYLDFCAFTLNKYRGYKAIQYNLLCGFSVFLNSHNNIHIHHSGTSLRRAECPNQCASRVANLCRDLLRPETPTCMVYSWKERTTMMITWVNSSWIGWSQLSNQWVALKNQIDLTIYSESPLLCLLFSN